MTMQEKAFPNPHLIGETGMTLRDYFAAKVMLGMFASGNLPKSVGDDEVAAAAYAMADAMMEERNAKQ